MSAIPLEFDSQQQLVQLSREVHRIAGTLARLSASAATHEAPPTGGEELLPVPVEKVRALIRARAHRARYLPEGLFADAPWDIMLDLLEAEISNRQVSVSSLCIAASVPPTTALRAISEMVAKGLLTRRKCPVDRRRAYIELTPKLSASLRRYFVETYLPCAP